jgi:Rad3-related DNA helicase
MEIKERIRKLAAHFFPFKDSEGKPLYRNGQDKIIHKIIELCVIDKKKFVAVEGPTGCGKSVINYTVLMTIVEIEGGRSVYLTPQKMLQDQIKGENWPGVRIVKGASGYSCNAVNNDDDMKYRCNYDKGDVPTCNTDSPIKTVKTEEDDFLMSINHVLNNTPSNLIPFKTSFNSVDKAVKGVDTVQEIFKEEYDYQMTLPAEERDAPYASMPEEYSSVVKAKLRQMSINSMSCKIKKIECPVNSARALGRTAKVRVLNPDIMFYLNKSDKSNYQKSSAIVIDEGHTFDGVMQRIFSSEIPAHTIKEVYGIDITEFNKPGLTNSQLSERFSDYVKSSIRWLVTVVRLMRTYSGVMTVRNQETYQWNKSESEGSKAFSSAFNSFFRNHNTEISVYDIISKCVVGNVTTDEYVQKYSSLVQKPLLESVHAFVKSACNVYHDILIDVDPQGGCPVSLEILANNILSFIGGSEIEKRCAELAEKNLNRGINDPNEIASKDCIVIDGLDNLYSTISDLNKNITLITPKDKDSKPLYMTDVVEANQRDVSAGGKLYDYANRKFRNGLHSALEIIPISPRSLANTFFYNTSPHTIVTTGTWIYPENQMKVLGMKPEETEFLKIPTTFQKERRPVYVLKNSRYTNYSEKDRDRNYVYTTDYGSRKAAKELCDTVNKIRVFMKKHHKSNANIIVHCNSFKLAEMIAKYGDSVYDNYIIQSPDPMGSSVKNLISGNIIKMYTKEDILTIPRMRPDSGLVIISPSISEGADFKHGIARAQIIMKHPIPYWGDKYLRANMDGVDDFGIPSDRTFADRITWMTLLQQYGRVMRDEKDWGYTFILDQKCVEAFEGIMNRKNAYERRRMNIEYMLEGVKCSYSGSKPVFTLPFKL